jgi:hypothetical protein
VEWGRDCGGFPIRWAPDIEYPLAGKRVCNPDRLDPARLDACGRDLVYSGRNLEPFAFSTFRLPEQEEFIDILAGSIRLSVIGSCECCTRRMSRFLERGFSRLDFRWEQICAHQAGDGHPTLALTHKPINSRDFG